jgi:outer membrane protein
MTFRKITSVLVPLTLAASVASAQGPAQPPAPAPAAPAPAAPAPARPATAAAPVSTNKIGFIDLQRVLARSSSGVAAREQLEKEKGAMQREMDGKRQELEKLRDELEKKAALMTADARREKQDAFERKRRDFTRLADDYQKELEKKEQGLLQRVLQDISGVIEKFGKERGYFMIVERRGAGLLYAAAEADLTDDLIRAVDQETGARGDASKGKK